jgi:Fungal Zn(2)-Cys(6) binuclear cluster domain
MEHEATMNRTASDVHAAKKLRLACDSCHGSKVRCSGGEPCVRCRDRLVFPRRYSSRTPSPALFLPLTATTTVEGIDAEETDNVPSNFECQYSYMSKLGKPKGSRNKKTLEKLAATTTEAAPQEGHADSLDTYPPPNDETHLFSHAGAFGAMRASEAYALPGRMDDTDFMGFSSALDAVLPEDRPLNVYSSPRGLLGQPTEKFMWGLLGKIRPAKQESYLSSLLFKVVSR